METGLAVILGGFIVLGLIPFTQGVIQSYSYLWIIENKGLRLIASVGRTFGIAVAFISAISVPIVAVSFIINSLIL